MNEENYVLTCNKIESLKKNKELKKIKVDSFKSTVDELSINIAKLFSLDKDHFDIMCFGRLLDSTKPLDFYGIYKGTVLYLIKKTVPQIKVPIPSMAGVKDEIKDTKLSVDDQTKCISLKTALINPLFRRVLENLPDFEKRENLITINPELRNDPTLFGILSDPELLNSYINRNNIKKVLKRYPHFLDVATQVSSSFLEELNSVNSVNNLGYRGASVNYSLDGASDDDDMDESETSSVSSTNTANSNHRLSDSTSLASMLMHAFNRTQQRTSNGMITPDMLREALQTSASTSSRASGSRLGSETNSQSSSQTLSQSAGSQSSSSHVGLQSGSQPNDQSSQSTNKSDESQSSATLSQSSAQTTTSSGTSSSSTSTSMQPPPPPPRSTAQILIGLAPQLQQMRELGITDDIVAIQALEATNGDVQAAINIIFSDMN